MKITKSTTMISTTVTTMINKITKATNKITSAKITSVTFRSHIIITFRSHIICVTDSVLGFLPTESVFGRLAVSASGLG